MCWIVTAECLWRWVYCIQNKMGYKGSFKWTYPQCKVNAHGVITQYHPAATIEDITRVIWQDISSLQASFSNIRVNYETSLRKEVSTVKEKVISIEPDLSCNCSATGTKQIVQLKVQDLSGNLLQSFEKDGCQTQGANKNTYAQKNNLLTCCCFSDLIPYSGVS